MATMQALIFERPGSIHVEERQIPEIGPGEVLLKVGAASVCASDIRVYKGEKKAKPGVIPGHEIAGAIAQVGEGVEGIARGERVVVCPIIACGECYFCLIGKRNRCLKRVTLGYDEDGGLANYVRIPQQLVQTGHVIPLETEMDYEVAAMTEPFACVLNSVETCKVQPGSSVLIIGAGPMGLMHLILSKAMGAAKIVVSDPLEDRLRVAAELGATHCVNPEKHDLVQEVMAATRGLGVDAGFLTFGTVAAMDGGLSSVRKLGFFNLFAGFPPDSHFDFDPNRIHYDELFVTGTQNANTDQYIRMARLLGVLPDARKLITHRFGAAEADKAYEARLGMEGLKAVVVYS